MPLDTSIQQYLLPEEAAESVNGTCRICLSTQNQWLLISIDDVIFDKISLMKIYHANIGQPLRNFKTHPMRICHTCEKDMIDAYQFRKRCLEAEDKLQYLEDDSLNSTNEDVNQGRKSRISRGIDGNGGDTSEIPSGICRICVKLEKNLRSMDGAIEGISYKELYQEVIQKPLKDFKSQPSLICQLCEFNMLKAYEFRTKCLETDQKLAQEMDVEVPQRKDSVEVKQEMELDDIVEKMNEDVVWEDIKVEPSTASPEMVKADESPTLSGNRVDKGPLTGMTIIPGGMCRICLKSHEKLNSIYDGVFKGHSFKEIYEEVIRKPLKDYRCHPPLICQPCLTDMLNAYEFRKRCLETEEKLLDAENKLNDDIQPVENVKVELEEEAAQKADQLLPFIPRFDLNELYMPSHSKDEETDGRSSTSARSHTVPQPLPAGDHQLPKNAKKKKKKYSYGPKKRFKCDLCPKRLSSFYGIYYHKLSFHEESEMAKCKICGKKVKENIMKWHVRSHDAPYSKTMKTRSQSIPPPQGYWESCYVQNVQSTSSRSTP